MCWKKRLLKFNWGQIKMQQQALLQDVEIAQLQFQLLLNSTTFFIPADIDYKLLFTQVYDTSLVRQHPTLKIIEQQQQIADAGIQLEKSRLLPDLSVGYNNTSIKGTGADNKYYSASKRFNAVQVGVGIPIFAKAQKAKISSAKLSRQLADGSYSMELQNIHVAYKNGPGRSIKRSYRQCSILKKRH